MKKTISIILAILMMVTLFSACAPEKTMVDEDIKAENQTENKEENLTDEKEPVSDDKKEENKNETVKNEENKKEETQKPETTQKPVSKEEKKASEIAGAMVSVIPSDMHNLEALPQELYKDIYGIDPEKFEEVSVYGTMINVKANEIIVIKVKNEADISTAKSVLEARKQQVYKTWEQYLPDQFEMVKQGVIKTNGKYAALIITPEVSKVEAEFIKLTK